MRQTSSVGHWRVRQSQRPQMNRTGKTRATSGGVDLAYADDTTGHRRNTRSKKHKCRHANLPKWAK